MATSRAWSGDLSTTIRATARLPCTAARLCMHSGPSTARRRWPTSSIPANVAERHRIPWYLWCAAIAVTSAYIGGYWDISWHRSIGRDTFWSPPHMAIYACGVLAGIASAYLILTATFARDTPLRGVSVRIWGLAGPLGAFILA